MRTPAPDGEWTVPPSGAGRRRRRMGWLIDATLAAAIFVALLYLAYRAGQEASPPPNPAPTVLFYCNGSTGEYVFPDGSGSVAPFDPECGGPQ